jgi:methanogenic corrinoid protein MtbC1
VSESFSPKQVARAIGVSESSLKRWCDRGLIPTICTAGGHRRLPIQGVLDFIKSTQRSLVHPEALGLPSPLGGKRRSLLGGAEDLGELLIAGDEPGARRLLMDLFLDHHRISQIGDQVLKPAFERIGQLWECGDIEVYRERLACQMCGRIIDELRRLIAAPPETAPLALGAAPSGDWYDLPGSLVELTLRQNGWRSLLLGNNLPFETLTRAIEKQKPRLFWLSVSHVADREHFARTYPQLSVLLGPDVPLLVGGRDFDAALQQAFPQAIYCPTLEAMEARLPNGAPATAPDA